jgi:uncharacterized protein (TIGR02453 family)
MTYFTKDFIQFFSELEKNNNKEWFHSNKKRYNQFVKNPMKQFVSDVVDELHKIDSEILIDPNKCIARINRDTRFSNDKTPYKTRTFGHIYKGDKSDPIPVIAFQLGAKNIGFMTGFYNPSKERLKSIRDKIKADIVSFQSLYSSKEFKDNYGSIKGDANKRIPPEYMEAFEKEPLIANKQFYYMKEFKSDVLLSDELLPLLIKHYYAAKPLNDFFSKSV